MPIPWLIPRLYSILIAYLVHRLDSLELLCIQHALAIMHLDYLGQLWVRRISDPHHIAIFNYYAGRQVFDVQKL